MLEHSIRQERLRRDRRALSAREAALYQIINRPMPRAERFAVLTEKWRNKGLNHEERAELLAIVAQLEGSHVERVEAVQRWIFSTKPIFLR